MAFEVHKLNALGLEKAKKLANEFEVFAASLEGLCANREYRNNGYSGLPAEVMLHLELACFYAKRALARAKENQE